MERLKAYFTKGKLFFEFIILQECRVRQTGEPCYLATIKGTEQMAWLYTDSIELITHKGNVVIHANPNEELVIVRCIE